MKVLNIIQRYPPAIGGSETWCSGIARFLRNKGIITKVATINLYSTDEFHRRLSIDQQYNQLGRYDLDDGVFITRYDLWNFFSDKWSIKVFNRVFHMLKLDKTEIGYIFKHSPHSFEMYFKLFREIKEADIIHLHTLPYFHGIAGFYIAKLLKKRIIITPHFHPGHPQFENKTFLSILNKSDGVITVSRYEKDHLIKRGIRPGKIFVTGNFVSQNHKERENENCDFVANLVKSYVIKPEAKKIIFLGRKELYKGIGNLIEAVRMLSEEEKTDFFVFLVGPDTTEFTLKYPDLHTGKHYKIINFGLVTEEEKYKLLQISDLLALPSEFEAFGIVFLEAWQHGKPVIGSNRGAIPEIINGAGLCAEYGNTEDLKKKIKMILFDKEVARTLGESGRERLKEYALDKIGTKVMDAYCKLRKRNRIFVVSHLFPPYFIGGSEVVAYEQSRMLKQLGYDMRVFAGRINNTGKKHTVRKEVGKFDISRLNLHDIDFDNNFINFEKKEVLCAFRQALFEAAPDIIHFHNIYSLPINMLGECHRMKIPSIMTLHDFWGICSKNILLTDEGFPCNKKGLDCTWCQRDLHDAFGKVISLKKRNEVLLRYLNMIDVLISPSRYLMNRFIDCGISRDKIVLINYGVDVSKFKNTTKSRSNKFRIGFIGQLIRHKGVENLLKAVSLLDAQEKSKISLILVGTGEKAFLDHCKKLINDLFLKNIVTFAGKIPNNEIPKIYRNLDILIVPSIWPENSPVTIIEAFASGTPVLGSDIGGIPELIHHGVNGFLHKYDSPLSLAQNIRRFIYNPRLASTLAPACFKKAQEYDLFEKTKAVADTYSSIMSS